MHCGCSLQGWAQLQVKVEEQRMEQTVHQTITAQSKNPGNIVRSVTSIRLGVDAERADEQDNEEGLADTLKEIVKRTVPSPVYAKYHEQHLQRFLSKLGAYTARQASSLQGPYQLYCWLLIFASEIFAGVNISMPYQFAYRPEIYSQTGLQAQLALSFKALSCPILWLGHVPSVAVTLCPSFCARGQHVDTG